MKIVINNCYGGFGLSEKAYKYLGITNNFLGIPNINRDDPRLIKCVEELGEEANGRSAELKIVEIPDDVDWVITEYDGMEQVEEKHRVWN